MGKFLSLDFKQKTTIVKTAALVLALLCYCLFVGFHGFVGEPYERLLLCSIFGGNLLVYFGLAVGVLTGIEVDEDLNCMWALLGFAGYIAGGIFCLVLQSSNKVLGIVTGFFSIIQGVVVGLDAWFIKNS